MHRRDSWIYAEMTIAELEQRRDALISLVAGTQGSKQRRYVRELFFVVDMLDNRATQMILFDSLE